MAKSPQQIVEEARKKNAAQEASQQHDTSALDELLSGITSEEAPVAVDPTVPATTEVAVTEKPDIPVTGVTTIEDAPLVAVDPTVPATGKTAVQDYAADANIAPAAPVTPAKDETVPEKAPVIREEEDAPVRVHDKVTLAEIEAGRKALEKYK